MALNVCARLVSAKVPVLAGSVAVPEADVADCNIVAPPEAPANDRTHPQLLVIPQLTVDPLRVKVSPLGDPSLVV